MFFLLLWLLNTFMPIQNKRYKPIFWVWISFSVFSSCERHGGLVSDIILLSCVFSVPLGSRSPNLATLDYRRGTRTVNAASASFRAYVSEPEKTSQRFGWWNRNVKEDPFKGFHLFVYMAWFKGQGNDCILTQKGTVPFLISSIFAVSHVCDGAF